MRKHLGILIISFILLAGCTEKPASTVLPAITTTPTQQAPTNKTPTPIFTPHPTAIYVSPYEIMKNAAGDICELGINPHQSYKNFFSPDHQWGSVVCDGPKQNTIVFRLDSNQTWVLPSYSLKFKSDSIPSTLMAYHWSKDGKYLYLRPYFCCADGPGLQFTDGYSLLRLNLQTGALETYFQPVANFFEGYAFSFSPDDRYLVYVEREQPRVIFINDLLSGEQKTLTFKTTYSDIGMFAWVPNSYKVIFVAAGSNWSGGQNGFSLFLYDLNLRQLTLLIDNDMRQLSPIGEGVQQDLWISESEIILMDYSSNYFKLNIYTKELTPYTPPTTAP